MFIVNFFLGKRKLQPFFQKLYHLAILGLNFSSASRYDNNGERFVLKYIKSKLEEERKPRLFDVGANVGVYSKHIIEQFDIEKIDLFVFEPSNVSFDSLKEELPKHTNIHLENAGLSDSSKKLTLFSDKRGSKLSSLYRRDLTHIGRDFEVEEEVDLITLDDYCNKNKIDYIHFLKLDVEGHELSVLNGARGMLENKKIQIIQFEFGGSNIDSRTFFKDFYLLLNRDYIIYRIVKNGLVELYSYSEDLEVFRSCNYLAVSR